MKILFSSHELEGTGIRLTQIEAESDNALNTVWGAYQVTPWPAFKLDPHGSMLKG